MIEAGVGVVQDQPDVPAAEGRPAPPLRMGPGAGCDPVSGGAAAPGVDRQDRRGPQGRRWAILGAVGRAAGTHAASGPSLVLTEGRQLSRVGA